MAACELALCAIFRDEAENLAEWLQFYRLIGVERFFLYDNGSTDDWRAAMAASGRTDDVVAIDAPGRGMQIHVYRHCLERFGSTTRWLAFVDLDEFLFATDARDLRLLLADYAAHPGLFAHWMLFGSGGHQERPPGLVTQNFVRRGRTGVVIGHKRYLLAPELDPTRASSYRPLNGDGKTIVRTSEVIKALSPHHFAYRGDARAVNEAGEPMTERFGRNVSAERVRINHYWSKSLGELKRKLARGSATGQNGFAFGERFGLQREALLNAEVDTTIFPLARKLTGWREAGGQ